MDSYRILYHPADRWRALAVLLLAALTYLPFIDNPLVFDDVQFFRDTVTRFAASHFDLTFRWFPYTTFGVTWVFAGEAPPLFRLQNLLLHGMNALLLLLTLRLWGILLRPELAGRPALIWGSWLGALIFVVHPLAVYGAGYLVQRSILMATFFSLVLHLAYFRGLLGGERRFLWLALAGYFCAIFSKEHALLAPLILVPLTWLLRRQIKATRAALLWTWLGFVFIALLGVTRVQGVLGTPYEKDAAMLFELQQLAAPPHLLHLLSVLTQAGLFFKYLALMLLPNPAWMSIDMRETFLIDVTAWSSWVGLIAYLVFGALGLWLLGRGGRHALLGFAMLYPWCQFPVEFSSVRIQEIFVLYRAYLWLPGVMLLAMLLAEWLPGRRMFWAAGLGVLLLLPLSWNRLWVFADNYRLWDDAVQLLHGENRIGAQRVYYGRAFAAQQQGKWELAIDDYARALSFNPANSRVQLALAKVLANAGRKEEALAEFGKVIARDPRNEEAWYGIGVLHKSRGEDTQALAAIQRSCHLGNNLACAMLKFARSVPPAVTR